MFLYYNCLNIHYEFPHTILPCGLFSAECCIIASPLQKSARTPAKGTSHTQKGFSFGETNRLNMGSGDCSSPWWLLFRMTNEGDMGTGWGLLGAATPWLYAPQGRGLLLLFTDAAGSLNPIYGPVIFFIFRPLLDYENYLFASIHTQPCCNGNLNCVCLAECI